jgi:transketolase
MSSFVQANADDVAIATIRTLAVDVVGKANSGHPGKSLLSNQVFIAQTRQNLSIGAPMGMAPVTHVLFSRLA